MGNLFNSQQWYHSFLEGSCQVDSLISLPLFHSPPFLDTEDGCTQPVISVTHLSTDVGRLRMAKACSVHLPRYRTCFSHVSFTASSRLRQNKLEDSCQPTNNLSLRMPCQSPFPPQTISGRHSGFSKRHLLISKASKEVEAAQMQCKVLSINNYSHPNIFDLISL